MLLLGEYRKHSAAIFSLLFCRESPTDVVVQHLDTGERVRVRCRTQVLQLALHTR